MRRMIGRGEGERRGREEVERSAGWVTLSGGQRRNEDDDDGQEEFCDLLSPYLLSCKVLQLVTSRWQGPGSSISKSSSAAIRFSGKFFRSAAATSSAASRRRRAGGVETFCSTAESLRQGRQLAVPWGRAGVRKVIPYSDDGSNREPDLPRTSLPLSSSYPLLPPLPSPPRYLGLSLPICSIPRFLCLPLLSPTRSPRLPPPAVFDDPCELTAVAVFACSPHSPAPMSPACCASRISEQHTLPSPPHPAHAQQLPHAQPWREVGESAIGQEVRGVSDASSEYGACLDAEGGLLVHEPPAQQGPYDVHAGMEFSGHPAEGEGDGRDGDECGGADRRDGVSKEAFSHLEDAVEHAACPRLQVRRSCSPAGGQLKLLRTLPMSLLLFQEEVSSSVPRSITCTRVLLPLLLLAAFCFTPAFPQGRTLHDGGDEGREDVCERNAPSSHVDLQRSLDGFDCVLQQRALLHVEVRKDDE
eukprot:768749-Hanusia_phi.AAC.26